jgi:hypothetical protein
MASPSPIRRRRYRRLLLVLPLVAALGLWVLSYGRFDVHETDLGQNRYILISTNGRLIFERIPIHVSPQAGATSSSPTKINLPYWSVWVTMAAVTIYSQRRMVRTAD